VVEVPWPVSWPPLVRTVVAVWTVVVLVVLVGRPSPWWRPLWSRRAEVERPVERRSAGRFPRVVGTFGWRAVAVVGTTVELEPERSGAGTTIPTTVETVPALIGGSSGLVVPAAAGGAADFLLRTS
jgi:hypothetical protein